MGKVPPCIGFQIASLCEIEMILEDLTGGADIHGINLTKGHALRPGFKPRSSRQRALSPSGSLALVRTSAEQ